MKAVSVLEHFSDHGSIHQKMKKNTTSVRSYPNSAGDAVSTFHDPGFFFAAPSSLPFRPFLSPVVARSPSLYLVSRSTCCQVQAAVPYSVIPRFVNRFKVSSNE
ncbi:hypothetical protein TNCV_3761671 [Trichonephila clavipes]|nr:hypothetical protein TNCV_3761671 [Trichonephila clavipes]